VRRLVKKLGPARSLRFCYEAGPCGYVLYWQLTELGVHCDVVAPTLVPVKAGDRIKTDRRDALKLARCYRAGDLTRVWVPDEAHEALRDLVRAREAAKKDQLRARHRLQKLLLRRGLHLRCDRGGRVGVFSRFHRPKQLMGYTGAVSREHSSGDRVRRGAITKTGNAHLRRILVEAAWSYRHRPKVGAELRRRQGNASEKVKEIAWKAQHRLHYRYARLLARGKVKQQIVTAVARELSGFVWAIGVEVEKQISSCPARAA
jgi:transposase